MKYMGPLLIVSDLKKSRYFYETLLQQVVNSANDESIIFKGALTLYSKSKYEKLLNKEISYYSNSSVLYFETHDIETAYSLMKNEKVTFVHTIKKQPWLQKVMRVYDYDGHLLEIGESVNTTVKRLLSEGYSKSKISTILNLSEETINKIIKSQ